jgi:hypothetical protein
MFFSAILELLDKEYTTVLLFYNLGAQITESINLAIFSGQWPVLAVLHPTGWLIYLLRTN